MSDDGVRSPRGITMPEGVEWKRMHPVSPLLRGWKAITAILAIVTVQNLDDLIRAWQYVSENGLDMGHALVRWVVLGSLGLLGVAVAALVVAWWMRSYAVDRDAVYLRSGLLVRQLKAARLPRIQSIDIVHPLLGRIVGLGQLTVDVAGGTGSTIVIGYLRTSELEDLRDHILDLAAGLPQEGGSAEAEGAEAGLQDQARPRDDAPGRARDAQDGATNGAADRAADRAAAGVADRAASGVADRAAASGLLTGARTAACTGGSEGDAARTAGPRGFETADGVGRLARVSREEHPLYVVDPKVLIGSILRSAELMVLAVFTLVVLAVGVTAIVLVDGGTQDLVSVLPLIASPVAAGGFVWRRFSQGWGFRAAATPAGIRMRYGLTSETSTTLPPGRVHGVVLEQSPLWRRRDWWRVKTCLAGQAGGGASASGSVEGDAGHVLLPVGDRDTALRALWLVAPELGVADPDRFLELALGPGGGSAARAGSPDDPGSAGRAEGAGIAPSPDDPGSAGNGVGAPDPEDGDRGRGFIRVSPRARIFSPIAWRREAIALTDTCVVLRLGRWWRRTSVIPYERVQSLSIHQGPLARRRGLAKIHLDMVDVPVPSELSNLDVRDAATIEGLISQRALRRRHEEQLDRWLARTVGVGALADSTAADPAVAAAKPAAPAAVAAASPADRVPQTAPAVVRPSTP